MRIHSVHLQNYRCFEDKTFEFPERFTVLIGKNGSGKSSLLKGMSVAAGAFLLGIEGVYVPTIYLWDVRRVSRGDLSFESQVPSSVHTQGSVSKDGQTYNLHWKRTVHRITGRTTADRKYSDKLAAIARDLQKRVRDGVVTQLPVLAYFGTGRLWAEFSGRLKYKKIGSRTELGYKTAFAEKSSVHDFLEWYKTTEDETLKFGNVANRAILKAFKDTLLKLMPDGWDDVMFSWRDDDLVLVRKKKGGATEALSFRSMSDGYQSVVAMIGELAWRCIQLNPHLGEKAVEEAEGIVLIDEIDLHIHPEWQKRIVDDLKRIFPKMQFVATTHSPFIVQSLRNSELIDLDVKEMDEDYSKLSVERIAEGEMGVENPGRSNEFIDLQVMAEDYFDLLNQAVASPKSNSAILDKLDYIEKNSNDPAWVALLRSERRGRGL